MNNYYVKRWFDICLTDLKKIYGDVEYGKNFWEWLIIVKFPLPSLFHQSHTFLLIETPGFNIQNHEGFNFYVRKGLIRQDKFDFRQLFEDVQPFEHIFENAGYNKYSDLGCARMSLHLTSFRPNIITPTAGDTLLDLTQNAYNFLGQKGL